MTLKDFPIMCLSIVWLTRILFLNNLKQMIPIGHLFCKTYIKLKNISEQPMCKPPCFVKTCLTLYLLEHAKNKAKLCKQNGMYE